jgi:hypothetical protein
MELVIHILGFAARSSQQTAISISAVCSWAREIALEAVWRVVVCFNAYLQCGYCD